MTQPNILELAKQGDVEAITSVINYLLKPQNVSAKAVLKDGCLKVILESVTIPEQESSVKLIRKLMINLGVESIKSVRIYGIHTGQKSAGWIDALNLTNDLKELKKDSSHLEVHQNSNKKTLTKLWPIWFPYPMSWFRALILMPFLLITLTASFRFTGFWGVILSAITNHRAILILAILLGILAPLLLVAYIHQFWMFIRNKQAALNRRHRYLPSIKSLWEGFYAEVVMCLSALVTMIILLPFFPLGTCYFHAEILYQCHVMTQYDINNYLANHYMDEIGTIIFMLTAAYLYQAECICRQRFIPKLKLIIKNYQFKPQADHVDDTDVEFDRLRSDMGLTQIKKGKNVPSNMTSFSEVRQLKHPKLGKKLFLILLVPLVAVGVYFLTKFPEIQETVPLPTFSKTQAPVSSQNTEITPSPVISKSPTVLAKSDTFREAVNQAISAANLTQSAKSQNEWKVVMSKWQIAIASMKAVPSSSPNYAVAQQKIIEYQQNLNYAQKNTINK